LNSSDENESEDVSAIRLPREIEAKILSYIDHPADIAACRLVCKEWKDELAGEWEYHQRCALERDIGRRILKNACTLCGKDTKMWQGVVGDYSKNRNLFLPPAHRSHHHKLYVAEERFVGMAVFCQSCFQADSWIVRHFKDNYSYRTGHSLAPFNEIDSVCVLPWWRHFCTECADLQNIVYPLISYRPLIIPVPFIITIANHNMPWNYFDTPSWAQEAYCNILRDFTCQIEYEAEVVSNVNLYGNPHQPKDWSRIRVSPTTH